MSITESKIKPKYTSGYFFQVVITLGIPWLYIIYKFFSSGYTYISCCLALFLYIGVARNVKKGLFFQDYMVVYFPFKVINRQKKISYNDVIKIKRGRSYYESVSLVIYFKNREKHKKIVLGYPSERNRAGILSILKKYGFNEDD